MFRERSTCSLDAFHAGGPWPQPPPSRSGFPVVVLAADPISSRHRWLGRHTHAHPMMPDDPGDRQRLRIAFAANLVMFAIGVVGRHVADSTSLLADAFDMLADASAIWSR